jgi:hypothetical protein
VRVFLEQDQIHGQLGLMGEEVFRQAPLQEAFERFHRENPQVYDELVGMARRWRRSGHERCGIGMLFEVLRYRYGLRTAGDEFKLNNNYRSRYARKIMAEHPDLDGFFETRELQSA